MKALVFAAGIGSRLKPWTDSHPKALVEVGGRPMLGRVIDNIIAAGISDIIVNVHHFAGQIVDWLASRNYQVDIEISDEKLDEEINKMAESYKMEADKLKEFMSDAEKKQMKEDMAVQEAIIFLVDNAVEK